MIQGYDKVGILPRSPGTWRRRLRETHRGKLGNRDTVIGGLTGGAKRRWLVGRCGRYPRCHVDQPLMTCRDPLTRVAAMECFSGLASTMGLRLQATTFSTRLLRRLTLSKCHRARMADLYIYTCSGVFRVEAIVEKCRSE